MDAAAPLGHGPVREALIEIAREESNERRVDPGVGVDVVDRADPVAMANRRGGRGNRRFGGAADRFDARAPQAVQRSPFFVKSIVLLDWRDPGRSRACRHVGPEPGQRGRLFENPRQLPAGRDGNAVEHDGPPEIEAVSDARDIGSASRPKLLDEQRLHVLGENASRREFLSIPRLGEEGLAAQFLGGVLDGLFERQVLEGVERVVVDEDADGPLRGQQRREVIDDARQRVVGRAGLV